MSVPGAGTRLIALLCSAAAALVFAAPAAAWTAAESGPGQVTVSDEVGASDAFTVLRVPGGFTVVNPATTYSGGVPSACALDVDAQLLACFEVLVPTLIVVANGGDDAVTSEYPLRGLGGDGLDTLVGSAGVDDLAGGAGGDVIDGGEGPDRLVGDGGSDQLSGGDGSDTLEGGDGDDALDGGAGDDVLGGHAGVDSLEGGAGADGLDGGDDGDVLSGGPGSDVLAGGAGDDEITGGSESDAADGGAGDDRVDGEAGDDMLTGGDGRDELDGGAGVDRVRGGPGPDRASGGPDGDDIDGDSGDDELFGDEGNDDLDGGDGRDSLELGAGDDTAAGGDGDDVVEVGAGVDAAGGGAGSDALTGSDLPGRATLDGGSGDDRLVSLSRADSLVGGDGADVLDAGAGDDVLDGGGGLDVLRPGVGADQVTGGADRDVASYEDVVGMSVAVSLDGVADDGPGRNANVAADVEEVVGSDGDDRLAAGSAGATLVGGAGADTLLGGAGADRLRGGFGDDLLDGSAGADVLDGEDDVDTATYASRTDRVVVRLDAAADDGAAGEGDLVSTTVEVVVGGAGPDDLVGAVDVANTLVGGAGDDRLDARSADGAPDLVQCGAGTDWASVDTIDTEGEDCEIVLVDGIQTRSLPLPLKKPVVTFGTRNLARGREGVAVVVLRCGPLTDRGCRGTVTMRLRSGRLLGTAKWTALPGQRRGIRVPLPSRRVRSLRGARPRIVFVRLVAVASDGAGRRATAKASARLRLAGLRRR